MPLIPDNVPESAAQSAPEQTVPEPVRRSPRNRLLRICFAIFTFEVGLFLVIFPWMDAWNINYIQGLVPALRRVWVDPYFRGAVSGLGAVNIYLAFLEVVRLLKHT